MLIVRSLDWARKGKNILYLLFGAASVSELENLKWHENVIIMGKHYWNRSLWLCGVYFCTLCPSIGPKERSRQALDRLPLVTNFLTNFWMEHFDGALLSPNSVRNAIWHALNEPVCQYLQTRNPRCSTVYIDNSLGPPARDSPCTTFYIHCPT